MRDVFLKCMTVIGCIAVVLGFSAGAGAQDLLERAKAGEPVRLGFANEVPWAYPGPDDKPLGFVNAHVLGVLETMGITNVEPVVTEWGGLIPGLNAERFDVVTGGMFILKSRCENMAFSDPIGVFGDAFIVPKGNPKNIQTYKDIMEQDGILVTGAGYNIVEAAKKVGLEDDNIMQVPGPTEILAAVRAERADAGGVNYFTGLNLVKQNKDAIEVTDPNKLPEWTRNWVGIGFRKNDTAFLEAFNKAQEEYLGSKDMLNAVAEYGYTKDQLPGDVTTEWVCAHR